MIQYHQYRIYGMNALRNGFFPRMLLVISLKKKYSIVKVFALKPVKLSINHTLLNLHLNNVK